MERRVSLRRLREILPSDGSPMTPEDVARACGVEVKTLKNVLAVLSREVMGVVIVRGTSARNRGSLRRYVPPVKHDEYAEPMRPDLAAIPGRDPATPAPVIPLRPRPAAPASPSVSDAEAFLEEFDVPLECAAPGERGASS